MNLVAKQNLKILSPGFLVEVFVFDITEDVNITDDEFYVRHTGIAKVLGVSPFNEDIKTHKDLKPGDIVLMGDHMSVMRLNPEWEDWYAMQKSNSPDSSKPEPIKYTKGFHLMMSQGRLFYTNRGKALITGENLRFGEDEIKAFRGPYVVFVDPQDILYGGPDINPFADVEE